MTDRYNTYPDRTIWHTLMAPRESCSRCFGRGYYPVEAEPVEMYCDCPAGVLRRSVDGASAPREPSRGGDA